MNNAHNVPEIIAVNMWHGFQKIETMLNTKIMPKTTAQKIADCLPISLFV